MQRKASDAPEDLNLASKDTTSNSKSNKAAYLYVSASFVSAVVLTSILCKKGDKKSNELPLLTKDESVEMMTAH